MVKNLKCYVVFNQCRYGPLKQHWTMRYESKHSYFKQLANSLGNYINICHSLSVRHEQWQCYLRMESSFFTTNPETGPGMYIHVCFILFPSPFRIIHTVNWFLKAFRECISSPLKIVSPPPFKKLFRYLS